MNSSDRVAPEGSRGRVSNGVHETRAGSPAIDRQRLVNRFEVWLDEVLEQDVPCGKAAREVLERLQKEEGESGASSTPSDLYSLWNAVVGLTRETGSHASASKALVQSLSPVAGQVASMEKELAQLEATLDRQRTAAHSSLVSDIERILREQQQAAEKARQLAVLKEVAETLVDLREGLSQSLEQAREALQQAAPAAPRGFLKRLMGQGGDTKPQAVATETVLSAQGQGLEAIEKLLGQWNIYPMDMEEKRFSPVTMRAVEQIDSKDYPDGTVLEILKRGYWQGKKVFRPAEVRVVRNQAELEGQ